MFHPLISMVVPVEMQGVQMVAQVVMVVKDLVLLMLMQEPLPVEEVVVQEGSLQVIPPQVQMEKLL